MLRNFKLFGVLLAAIILTASGKVDAATNWNTNVIQATGMCAANPQTAINPTHAVMQARIGAKAEAYRQLAEMVNGVQVDAETTVEQMMLTNDTVRTKVSATIRGARVVDEGEISGGGYFVTLELPLFGETNSIAQSVFERPAYIEPFPTPAPDYRPPVIESRPSYDGGYTGLIVDCRGIGYLNPVMSPVIKDATGQKIYGHKNLDYDRIIREGMASYARDMSEAGRAGSNPLIVQAVYLEDHNANPVLSAEDADFVLYQNKQSRFLENIAVVFLY